MVAFLVKNFGGTLPKEDPRSLPDNMAQEAVNCDLTQGLAGLPIPELLHDLSAASGTVRKAYRFPAPVAGDPDAWLPLPSEYSSVVRSPLANDTLHRIYWTNPPDSSLPGAWWNTYARITAGNAGVNAPFNLGFLSPDAADALTVTASGGTIPQLSPNGVVVVAPGSGYIPGTVLTLVGGTVVSGTSTTLSIVQTQAATIAPNAGGSGGVDGTVRMWGTTGAGSRIIFRGVVSGGALTSIDSIISHGGYTGNPTLTGEPVVGDAGTPTGATVDLTMGVFALAGRTSCGFSVVPANPVATTDSGSGTGCTVNVSYLGSGAVAPEISRSYLFTYVDAYGLESSPSPPSPVIDAPPDATWTITGLPTSAPTNPVGKNFPTVVKMRLYRTITGQTTGANFYYVSDVAFGLGTFTDTTSDATIVNNTVLESTSWLSPPDELDGLTAMQGGMLVGFTGNTIHFSEVNRPHAWPAGYDQSLQYEIIGLAVWQQALIALTKGYPSTGQGGSPANFTFSQVQVAEPCIARGSIVADLTGVTYASQNGLVSLNYSGMTNLTQNLFSKNIWINDYNAASIVACRHRAQYIALTSSGGFIIDYTEPRMGVTRITLSSVSGIWNDVYTGDVYAMGYDKKVYLWDSGGTGPLQYRWRSRQFYFPAPQSLGACQISSTDDLENPPNLTVPPVNTTDYALPADANAVFNLYAGLDQETPIFTRKLRKAQEIFRLPSGRKVFNWSFEVVSRGIPIYSVELASTMKELSGA